MRTNHVVVTDYDPRWVEDFEQIAAEIRAVADDLIIGIEHVGSTAVPGLAAKPIIDLDVIISDYTVFSPLVQALHALGYRHEGNLGIEAREAFTYDNKPHLRTHHLYVCPQDSPELARHLRFRDFLRNHPDATKEYGEIKKTAAQLYPHNVEAYLEHKGVFIEEIYRQISALDQQNRT
ncbi:GrpB family protein [Boudabousia marimammalium]|uniref:GrpB family protein n=1 Tax=Boudabousia marimammalium TaxID=156892 RepID=A0A1Q5PSR4_9ACTO|nr:GrpB family protein [Boudabousia marimammalium]OKL50485.1 hypothetical protein BM477_00475 [Boudabousia marimammalium]